MRPSQTRRTLLATLGSALSVALAGCLTGTPGDDGQTDDARAAESTTAPTTTPRGRPDVDCASAFRPPETTIGDAETPSDASLYPERPESLSDESAVETFLTEYERAYRRNALAEQYGDGLTAVGVPLGATRWFDSREGAAVVRVRYEYYYGYTSSQEDGDDSGQETATVAQDDSGQETATVAQADSATTYATYYLDDRVLVRAERSGILDDESVLRPDPWVVGRAVECWE